MIKSFLDLEIYQESFRLMCEIEELLKSFPNSERFLLTDQLRRAIRAIPALIAEGYARRESLKDFQKYLRECIGEANEIISHLRLVEYKGYIKKPGYCQELIERYDLLGKKIYNLKNNWQNYR